MLTRARAVVLAVAGLSLAACSNVHPGAAAVVGDTSISMKTLDETAAVYCIDQLNQAKQQGITAVSNGAVRQQAVLALATLTVAREIADEKGLEIDPGSYEVPDGDRDAVAKAFPGIDVDTTVSVISDSREISAIALALGEASTGQTATEQTQAQLAEVGQKEITDEFAAKDVKFSPRFALSPSGQPRDSSTGSISVAPVDLEATPAEELPDDQRCS